MKLLHDAYRFMGRAVQSWQYAVFRLQFGPENIALMIQQPLVAPARNRHLFFKLNLQRRRPLPSDAGTVYPGVTDQLILNLLQVQLQQRTAQASGQCLCQCRFVQVARGTRHADLGDRLIEPVPEFTQGRAADADKHYQQREQYNGTPITIQPLWRLLIGYTPAHRLTLSRLPYAGFQPPTDRSRCPPHAPPSVPDCDRSYRAPCSLQAAGTARWHPSSRPHGPSRGNRRC